MSFRPSVTTGCVHRTPSGGGARAASVLCGVAVVAGIFLACGSALAEDSHHSSTASRPKREGLFSWLLYPVTGKQASPAAATPAATKASGTTPSPSTKPKSGSALSQAAQSLSQPTTWAPAFEADRAKSVPHRSAAVPTLQQPQYFAPGSGPIIAAKYGNPQPDTAFAATNATGVPSPPVNRSSSTTTQPTTQQATAGQSSLWQMAMGTNPLAPTAISPPQVTQPTVTVDTSRLGQARSLVDQMIGPSRTSTASAPRNTRVSATNAASQTAPPAKQFPSVAITPPSDAARTAVRERIRSTLATSRGPRRARATTKQPPRRQLQWPPRPWRRDSCHYPLMIPLLPPSASFKPRLLDCGGR